MITIDQQLLSLNGTQIAEAIIFHLCDENWFNPVPPEVEDWVTRQLPKHKKINFKADEWHESQTGTRRMLWLLVSAQIDPYGLCRFVRDEVAVQVMHRRFTDIMDTWGAK